LSDNNRYFFNWTYCSLHWQETDTKTTGHTGKIETKKNYIINRGAWIKLQYNLHGCTQSFFSKRSWQLFGDEESRTPALHQADLTRQRLLCRAAWCYNPIIMLCSTSAASLLIAFDRFDCISYRFRKTHHTPGPPYLAILSTGWDKKWHHFCTSYDFIKY